MEQKTSNKLVVNRTQQKFAKSHARVPHTFREDGTLKFGDGVMLKNCLTNGTLVCDMSDRITSNDEAYAVTTREGNVTACARAVMHLVRA
jgi:hypothetical protein